MQSGAQAALRYADCLEQDEHQSSSSAASQSAAAENDIMSEEKASSGAADLQEPPEKLPSSRSRSRSRAPARSRRRRTAVQPREPPMPPTLLPSMPKATQPHPPPMPPPSSDATENRGRVRRRRESQDGVPHVFNMFHAAVPRRGGTAVSLHTQITVA